MLIKFIQVVAGFILLYILVVAFHFLNLFEFVLLIIALIVSLFIIVSKVIKDVDKKFISRMRLFCTNYQLDTVSSKKIPLFNHFNDEQIKFNAGNETLNLSYVQEKNTGKELMLLKFKKLTYAEAKEFSEVINKNIKEFTWTIKEKIFNAKIETVIEKSTINSNQNNKITHYYSKDKVIGREILLDNKVIKGEITDLNQSKEDLKLQRKKLIKKLFREVFKRSTNILTDIKEKNNQLKTRFKETSENEISEYGMIIRITLPFYSEDLWKRIRKFLIKAINSSENMYR